MKNSLARFVGFMVNVLVGIFIGSSLISFFTGSTILKSIQNINDFEQHQEQSIGQLFNGYKNNDYDTIKDYTEESLTRPTNIIKNLQVK